MGRFNKTTGELAYGIMGSVLSVPPGFSCETIISYTHGGPRKAMEEWGTRLLNRYGKSREESFADFTTNYLQYSTDNGAFYYYLTENNKTYEETIIDVKKYAESEGIPY